MIIMPDIYKKSMNETFRNQSYIFVSIGVINQEAQTNANIDTSVAKYCYLSDFKKPLEGETPTKIYSSFETKGFKADGTQYYPPKNINQGVYNQGVLTDLVNGSVVINFNKEYSIRGLSINFGANYPTRFEIAYTDGKGAVVSEIYDNTSQFWKTETIHEVKSLKITPKSFVTNGENRLRIYNITMGVGISFENNRVISADNKEYVSAIVDDLPAVDFNMKVENYARQFDVENVKSPIHYLEVGQEVTVRYGYEVEPNNVMWVDGGVFNLTDWDADDTTLSVTAKDKIEALDRVYRRGKVGSITAYDLAVDVLTDAGLKAKEYMLDDYLKTISITNPMPCVTHREALQIIANACRCALRVNREGVVVMQPAFITVASPDRMLVTSNTATAYSNLKSVIDGSAQVDYATFSVGQFSADGTTLYLPKDSNYLKTGFVSNETAKADGTFAVNPSFKIKLESTSTYYSIGLDFSTNPAKKTIVRTYKGGVKQIEVILKDLGLKNEITRTFMNFDEIEFEFIEGVPNSRVFVDSVRFGDISDYNVTYNNMLQSPKGIQLEKTSRVNVVRHTYLKGTQISTLFDEEVDFTNVNEYIVEFSEATHDIVATANGATVNVLESSAYMAKLDVSKLSGVQKLLIEGKTYVVVDRVVSKVLDSRGKIETFDNPLISTDEHATLQAEWLANYYSNNVEYNISYRGEPRIEGLDILTLENKYVDKLAIQVYEHNISFNGALRGTMKARRIKREGV